MIAQELEVSLHMAFVEARQKRHEFITVEHLLLALLDNPTAADALRARGANLDGLRKHRRRDHAADRTRRARGSPPPRAPARAGAGKPGPRTRPSTPRAAPPTARSTPSRPSASSA